MYGIQVDLKTHAGNKPLRDKKGYKLTGIVEDWNYVFRQLERSIQSRQIVPRILAEYICIHMRKLKRGILNCVE